VKCAAAGCKWSGQNRTDDMRNHHFNCARTPVHLRKASRERWDCETSRPSSSSTATQQTLDCRKAGPLPPWAQHKAEEALLKFAAMNGVPFSAFDSDAWKEFMEEAAAGFKPPSE
jgi:hypothetical protein